MPVIMCAPWRDPLPQLRSQIPTSRRFAGDALKTEDVEAALVGVDVVIQTLGVGLGDLFRPVHLFSDATRVLIAAMRGHGVKRLICVTGFGAGDSRASISCLQRLPFQIVFGRAYEDKSLQERFDPGKRARLDDCEAWSSDPWTADRTLQDPC